MTINEHHISDAFLAQIPEQPGVYIMKNADNQVLYIGKSANLKARVRSYFRKSSDTRYSIKFIQKQVTDIEFCMTATEKEALILENNLIKKHRPRYNIRLRDDKNFFHIRIKKNEPFPRLELVRRQKRDGALYFGPYSSSRQLKETIRYLQLIYPLRTCKDGVFKNRSRPCLLCQIRKCSGPCTGNISTDDYHHMLEEIIMILQGNKSELVDSLKKQMSQAAQEQRFEHAAVLRDRIYAIEQSLEQQKIVSQHHVNKDVFGILYDSLQLSVHILQIRRGRLDDSNQFILPHNQVPEDELISSFLQQFYQDRPIPDTLWLRHLPEDYAVIEEWLTEQAGKKITISTPQRGETVRLLDMAEKSARQNLLMKKERGDDLASIKTKLNLTNNPQRIECFDISTFHGDSAVGSNVVFIDGQPKKNLYRRYKIKTVSGQNDFAMMHEVLTRRLERAIREQTYPDLIIIDGGKGQLNAALSTYVQRADTIPHIDFIAIAKENTSTVPVKKERIFLPNQKNPVFLLETSEEKKVLDRIRDEAHRFAVSYHRNLRKKNKLTSKTLSISGIGVKREQLLLTHFGSLKNIKTASLEQLLQVQGIGQDIAQKIFGFFHPDLI